MHGSYKKTLNRIKTLGYSGLSRIFDTEKETINGVINFNTHLDYDKG